MRTILIVDGNCRRGVAIIRHLSSTGEYHILAFTRSTTCPAASAVSTLPGVTLLLNRATTGYDLQTFAAAAQRCPNVLVCSNSSNAEGKEGVQWGARLVQAAVNAGVKHLVFSTMESTRKQFSTDSCIASQGKTSMAWTIIRSPAPAEQHLHSQSSKSSTVVTGTDERAVPSNTLQNLANYVHWSFVNTGRSTGADFTVPATITRSSNTSEPKRRDSKAPSSPEQSRPALSGQSFSRTDSSQGQFTSGRMGARGQASSVGSYLEPDRARAIQQWVASTPSRDHGKQRAVESSEEEGEFDKTDSESE